eukprot:516739_1
MAARGSFTINSDQVLECDNCGFREDEHEEWKNEDDDFIICIKNGCNKRYTIFCRICIKASHSRKPNHTFEGDPTNFINIREKQICSKCQLVHSDAQHRNGLFVCTKSSCNYQNRVMCKICMIYTHTIANADHDPINNTNDFMLLEKWHDLSRMNKIKPDGKLMTCAKSATKLIYYGGSAARGGCWLLSEAGKEILKSLPKNAGAKQWATAIQGALKASEISGKALMKSLVTSQAYTTGLVFAAECGYYLFQYSYSGSITWDELTVKVSTAAKAHTSGFVCSMIAGGIGFLIGGPIGAAIGAAVGGMSGDFTVRWYCDADDQKEYEKTKDQISKALTQFNYSQDLETLLNDKNKFNVDELKRRYHMRALWNHPDVLRQQGCYTEDEIKKKWSEFSSKYAVLLNICKQRDDAQ